MQRRRWLQLGVASAVVLATLGGAAVLWQPALVGGRLSTPARGLLEALGDALLDGSLPPAPARAAALEGLLARTELLVGALPAHSQAELAQLLSLLAHPAGRVALAGLQTPWTDAPLAEVQQALQGMRHSSIRLRQQAYQALHDILGSAYFSEPATWAVLGYPGPQAV